MVQFFEQLNNCLNQFLYIVGDVKFRNTCDNTMNGQQKQQNRTKHILVNKN